jgi:hypothetical protein
VVPPLLLELQPASARRRDTPRAIESFFMP